MVWQASQTSACAGSLRKRTRSSRLPKATAGTGLCRSGKTRAAALISALPADNGQAVVLRRDRQAALQPHLGNREPREKDQLVIRRLGAAAQMRAEGTNDLLLRRDAQPGRVEGGIRRGRLHGHGNVHVGLLASAKLRGVWSLSSIWAARKPSKALVVDPPPPHACRTTPDAPVIVSSPVS